MARTNRVTVSVKYYVPCMDEENFAFLRRGRYVTETGICWKVDADVTRTMLVGETEISLDDVIEVTAQDETLFNRWMEE